MMTTKMNSLTFPLIQRRMTLMITTTPCWNCKWLWWPCKRNTIYCYKKYNNRINNKYGCYKMRFDNYRTKSMSYPPSHIPKVVRALTTTTTTTTTQYRRSVHCHHPVRIYPLDPTPFYSPPPPLPHLSRRKCRVVPNHHNERMVRRVVVPFRILLLFLTIIHHHDNHHIQRPTRRKHNGGGWITFYDNNYTIMIPSSCSDWWYPSAPVRNGKCCIGSWWKLSRNNNIKNNSTKEPSPLIYNHSGNVFMRFCHAVFHNRIVRFKWVSWNHHPMTHATTTVLRSSQRQMIRWWCDNCRDDDNDPKDHAPLQLRRTVAHLKKLPLLSRNPPSTRRWNNTCPIHSLYHPSHHHDRSQVPKICTTRMMFNVSYKMASIIGMTWVD